MTKKRNSISSIVFQGKDLKSSYALGIVSVLVVAYGIPVSMIVV